ncbi:MAG: wax ester/triacylglycerol synthase domain-containing protein [Ilumatobacteraceae bacterium]
MTTGIRFDRKMSEAEGLMWRLDKDPYLSSTFANLSVLDRAPDFDRLRRRMERASIAIPRLRQRVQSAPANLTPPLWVDDPDFDIDYHVRRVSLPAPGSMRQMLDLATLITNDPFDRTRPLWQFVVIEGLDGDRAVLVEKLHHSIADGEGSVQLSLQFFDFERDAPEPSALEWEPSADTSSILNADVWREMLAGPMKLPLALVKQMRELIADPTQIPANGSATIDTLRGVIGQMTDVEPARSPLWTTRSLRRRAEVLSAPFTTTRDAARSMGGTLNTALLCAAADAAGRYHRALGAPIDELRASMAISTRKQPGDGEATNAFSLARMLVPTAEMPVHERFRLVNEATIAAANGSAASLVGAAASLATSLPTGLITRMARLQSQTVDFATSNVKGTPIPVYVAGSQIVNNFPLGPLGGVAFNLTLLSHVGSLDMGLNMDAGAISHPEVLRECLHDAFDDLLTSTKKSKKRTSPKK